MESFVTTTQLEAALVRLFVILTCHIPLLIVVGLYAWHAPVQAADHCPGPRDHSIRPKVVGGWQANLQDWPGQVVLRIHNPDRGESAYLCGGSLIASSWVLTAAHCFKGREFGQEIQYFRRDAGGRYYSTMEDWGFDKQPLGFRGKAYLEVALGTDDLRKVTQENARQVKRIIVHPDYTEAATSGHDVALVELKRPWQGALARLSTQRQHDPETPPGVLAMVAGFGDQKWRAPLKRYVTTAGGSFAAGSEVLREVDLPTLSTPDCSARFPGDAIGSGQICAGHEEGRKDSCQGDSGGPLVAFDKMGCPYQIGIVSWGPECASRRAYGVYTRVSSFLPWIRQFVPDVRSVLSEDIPDPTAVTARLAAADQALAQIESLLGPAKGATALRVRRRQGGTGASVFKVRLNELYVFEVSSEVDGRLIIVDINTAGENTQIFPNKFVRSNNIGRIDRDQNVRIPGPGYGFDWFRAVEPVGKSRLLVLVVPDEFAARYESVARRWANKGLAPEKAPSNFLANLIDQIYGLLGMRGFAPEAVLKEWAFDIVEYEIVH